ncbi:DUF6446 family protein [Pseudooceanicola sp. 200-1SW]|uniref:DUF6446 family protein n=1 Tax=Pseudooceanicola sp. 200-1SW TaxID=3425949 RepID=UPI003D7F341C
MLGRILIVALLITAVVAGGALYYLQVYAFYEEVAATGPEDVQLTTPEGGLIALPHTEFRAIDADSSPIRYRACFLDASAAPLAPGAAVPYPAAEPLQGPRWFDCFDAGRIATLLDEGRATAYLSIKNVHYGVDRIVALDQEGHGWVWHQLNNCGEIDKFGNPVGEACPPR